MHNKRKMDEQKLKVFEIIIQSFLIIYCMLILINLYVNYCFTIEIVSFQYFCFSMPIESKKNLKSGQFEVGGFGFQVKFMRLLLIMNFFGCTYFC